jgi:Family of unknown function (DUF5677)
VSHERAEKEALKALLTLSIDAATRAASALRFSFSNPVQRYSVALFFTIIEQATAVLALTGTNGRSAIPAVTRTAMDAYADIANLCDNSGYWEHLEAADHREWKQVLERASRGGNPYFAELEGSALLPDARRAHAQLVTELEKRGKKKLEPRDRYGLAGLTHEYESAYSLLSACAHNNVSVLLSRHCDLAAEPPAIRLFNANTPYEASCMLTTAEIVLRSAEKVLRMCGHGVAVLSEARRELERLHAKIAANIETVKVERADAANNVEY